MVISCPVIKGVLMGCLCKITCTKVKMSWFLSFSSWGLLGSSCLRSQMRRLPLLASPFPPVKRRLLIMCIVRTSSLWAFKLHSTFSVIKSQIVMTFSQAVSMMFLSGSTMTYLTSPARWTPDKSEIILLVSRSQIFKLFVLVEINMLAWTAIEWTALLCASIFPNNYHLFTEYSASYFFSSRF